jgi:hypothetical protein
MPAASARMSLRPCDLAKLRDRGCQVALLCGVPHRGAVECDVEELVGCGHAPAYRTGVRGSIGKFLDDDRFLKTVRCVKPLYMSSRHVKFSAYS